MSYSIDLRQRVVDFVLVKKKSKKGPVKHLKYIIKRSSIGSSNGKRQKNYPQNQGVQSQLTNLIIYVCVNPS